MVCGRRDQERFRVREVAGDYSFEVPKAEIGIGSGATARVRADSVAMPDGQISKRIMITITKPF